ncbi:hypothetical protein PG994_011421 [Apiospora phragmitis]|uniref:GED domain-containing protein n=1 Tax=Apiospora phragmitis TaxID=2905665 RepID=A0ABR1TST2_9PEZI
MAPETTKDLQSQDHKVLMDIIDGLRSKGVSRYIDLPQIVACGGQSSGKSSVLQAISGLSFPVGTNLTTTFATELVLRRTTETSEERCRVSIQPGKDHSDDQRKKLEAFGFSTTFDELDVGNVADRARDAMALTDAKRFCDDVLRIEVSGPTQPHLTIVDLPGLFTAGNRDQSREEGQLVKSLVRSYMKNPRSIILAVVSAKSQFAEQSVTDQTPYLSVRKMEEMYFKLAWNEDVDFRLGWHVVVNRDYHDRAISNTERDEKEVAFLSSGIWNSLPQSHKGVAALRTRLSEVLRDHIIAQLPRVVTDIEDGLRECTDRLERLGDARGEADEQRKYLLNASHRFSSLIRSAVYGSYGDSFFGNAREDEGYHKRLRAVLQNTLEDFAQDMRKNGQARDIIDFSVEGPEIEGQVSRSDYLAEVRRLMRRNRGCELPGTYNPLIITELFHEQCQPWADLVEKYSTRIISAVDSSVNSILSHVVDEETKDRLWMGHIGEALEKLKTVLRTKNSELLTSHETAHPITYNYYLTETVQKIEAKRYEKDLRRTLEQNFDTYAPGSEFRVSFNRIVDVLTSNRHADMGDFGAANAVDMSEAYYKVTLKRVVDDVAHLAVENCLTSKLPELFTPESVAELSDEDIKQLAAESEDTVAEREALLSKLDVLSKGLGGLKRLTRHHPPVQFGFRSSHGTSSEDEDSVDVEEKALSTSSSPSPRPDAVHLVREGTGPSCMAPVCQPSMVP